MPTWQERAPLAQQFGIQNYTGTPEQNTELLAKLQAQPSAGVVSVGLTSPLQPSTTQFPNLSPSAPNQDVLDKKAKLDAMLGQLKVLQDQQKSALAYESGLGKTGGEIPTPVLSETPQQAQQSGRITNLEGEAFAPPTKTYDEIYKSAYEQSGLANIQTSISAKDAEISKAKEALINEEGKITENPWLTETGRVGRIRTLYEMAEPQIARLVAERGQLQNQLTTGTSQAEQVAIKTQAEELAGRTLKQQELDYLLKVKASETPEKGTPQLKTDNSGQFVWLYPDGTSIQTGMMAQPETGTIPTSYKEWQLAGSPDTYARWLQNTKPQDLNVLLSPAEVEKLGVPYGTTKGEAARIYQLNNTLQEWKNQGYTREQIEAAYKEQNGVDEIPIDMANALDVLFKPGLWENIWSTIKFWD